MVNVGSILKVSDNSGALTLKVIQVKKTQKRCGARPGSLFKGVVQTNQIKRHIKKKSRIILRRQKLLALLTASSKPVRRLGGWSLRSDSNTGLPLNNFNLVYGTRIFGPTFYEVRTGIVYKKVAIMSEILL